MIYFMQTELGAPIKIGYTQNLDARKRALELHYGVPLNVLDVREGGKQEEREWHEQFAHLRLGRTEQFKPAADLLAAIGQPLLVDVNLDAVEAMPVRRWAGLATVKIHDDVFDLARIVAAYSKGMTVTDLLSGILKPALEKMHAEVVAKFSDAANPAALASQES